MARKATNKTGANVGGTILPMRVAHRIEVLLHTMRAIERHEEQLCQVMTEIRNTGEVSGATRKELRGLLEELPVDACKTDLDAVSLALLAEEGLAKAGRTGAVSRAAAKKMAKAVGKRSGSGRDGR